MPEAVWPPSLVTTRFSVSCLLAKSAQKAIDDRKCWLVVPGPAVGHRAIPDNGERDCASRNISVFETHAVICSVVFGFVHAGTPGSLAHLFLEVRDQTRAHDNRFQWGGGLDIRTVNILQGSPS